MDVIRTYVKGAFSGVAQTPEALEQQQELITNMQEKVRDLVAEGKGEQEALGITIAEAGDLTILAAEFPPAEAFVAGPRTVQIRLAEHALLSRIGGVFSALVALVLLTAFVGSASAVRGGAFLIIIGATGVGVWRVWAALRDHRTASVDAVGEFLIDDFKPLGTAILQWVAVCAVAGILNISLGSIGMWAWAVWAAALALPAEALVSLLLVRLGVVSVRLTDAPAAAEATACAGRSGTASAAA
jgi:hypothetical protein